MISLRMAAIVTSSDRLVLLRQKPVKPLPRPRPKKRQFAGAKRLQPERGERQQLENAGRLRIAPAALRHLAVRPDRPDLVEEALRHQVDHRARPDLVEVAFQAGQDLADLVGSVISSPVTIPWQSRVRW